jgi:hypothetical protein
LFIKEAFWIILTSMATTIRCMMEKFSLKKGYVKLA